MTYEGYVFLVCLIVFLTFTILFTFVIALIVKMKLKMIRNGLEDEEIKKEEENKANASRFGLILSKTITSVFIVVLAVAFAFSLYLNFTEGKAANGIPSLKVVRTSSMSEKNKNNKYLFDNSLDNQIQAFDMIVTRHLPKEEDLKLYDIVVYKKGDAYIIHRIIGIEEPNEKHPNCRQFLLQGDANYIPDEFPVLYDQMIGIYQGERIPYVGTIVLFLQSPAGYLCLLLVAFAIIATPLVEKKLEKEKRARLSLAVTTEIAVTNIATCETLQEITFSDNETEESILSAEELLANWHAQLVYVLSQIKNVNREISRSGEIYRKGKDFVAKLSIKDKYLFAELDLNANDYQSKLYDFNDVAGVNAKVECKILTRQNLENVKKILATYGKNIQLEMPKDVVIDIPTVSDFDRLKNKTPLTFKQKLRRLSLEKKEIIKDIVKILEEKPKVSKWESKKGLTFKSGRRPLVKIAIKGKSIYTYLAVDPKEYVLSKYGIKDVSNVKAHKDYPSECKITSSRKLKYLKEIINEKI